VERNKGKDEFKVKRALLELDEKIEQGSDEELVNQHSHFAQALDAFITYLDKQNGDVADIIQNIRWQLRLFSSEKFANFPNIRALEKLSNEYIKAYTSNKITERAYSVYIQKILNLLTETASYLGDTELKRLVKNIEQNINNPQRLQKAHYTFLLQLAGNLK
jgi:hypothetical protein